MTQADRILAFLQNNAGGRAYNYELSRISLRYGARLYELRRRGHVIQTWDRPDRGVGITEYRLIA